MLVGSGWGLQVWDWIDGLSCFALNAQALMGKEYWRNTQVLGLPEVLL